MSEKLKAMFPSFEDRDFALFEKRKWSNRGYNPDRKSVWERMKVAKELINQELNKRGIHLHDALSRFYPYPFNKYKVNGIWIGYSELSSRYFEAPHLSFGIYEDHLLVGLVVNPVATKELIRIANLVEREPWWFLQEFNKLDPERRVVWYGTVQIESKPTPGQLSELANKIRNEKKWFVMGEVYGLKECPDICRGLDEKIVDVFEKLMLMYHLSHGNHQDFVEYTDTIDEEAWVEGDEVDEADLIVGIPSRTFRRRKPHVKLSRSFRNWIRENYSTKIRMEKKDIDVEFQIGENIVCAELKTSSEGNAREMIRSALGQLLEYNLYSTRKTADQWMIVIDIKPLIKDRYYIDKLRTFFPKPLYLCWQEKNHFKCHPSWPED